MRILFMADVPRDPNAGASGTEVRTIEALRSLGHHVTEVWSDQLRHRVRHPNLHYLLELPREYRRVLREHPDFDVYHVNQPHGWLAARERRRGVFVHRSHGIEPRVEEVRVRWQGIDERPMLRRAASALMRKALIDRHARLIARYADGHIVSSSEDRDYLTTRLGVDDERVAIIPQAPLDEFLSAPAPPLTAERLGRVLYVGQFADFKAPEIVAAAMRRLAHLQCTWVCSRQHHQAVRALAGDHVELLDWMPAEKLRGIYDAHGVLLFPSLYEGFGKVFLEGMSRGMCVVATPVGGVRDVMTDGRDGLIVPIGDAGAIVDAVTQRATSEIGSAAAETARRYTWERVARETAAFYRSLLERRRR